MHLKSITLKGFKSFPERTKLEFSPGVSVIVGPNGSGKSNITDAVLWALGEQSPGAIRGASMQDVISAGGKGIGQRRAAEVEVVIDNSDGRAATEFSEIAVERRLDRAGDSGYRLNGARARLADVSDVLSDTNLGREMHSVISQGRVEEIVLSAPRERRLLVEEAAGLGKHRKRRRRAQLKLERTQDNLDRALDVEREARSRAVEAVRALPPALEPAGDRDLGKFSSNARRLLGSASGATSFTIAFVDAEHHLDLGVSARPGAVAARVDHVLHRLAADAQRALLAERPEDGVGGVALAGAVGADDHADARREDELGALGKGFEALDADRAQVHGE